MNKWKKKSPTRPPLLLPIIFLFLIFIIILFLISYASISKSLFTTSSTLNSQFPQCTAKLTNPISGEKFLWFAPHSGFSNQLLELKNAILMAVILNRTLIVPPVMDHHAVALGSCPKFRVLDPKMLRLQVWNHTVELNRSKRYVSMASIVDLSALVSLSLMVKFVDFWDFAMFWCGIDMDLRCLDGSGDKSSVDSSLRKCGSFLSGLDGNVERCLYALDDDCKTTVWTYQEDKEDGILDSFQPDEQLRKKKKVAYVRRRRDVFKALGPGTEAGSATVLAFGSLFTSPYKGSELSIDIHDAPRDHRLKSLFSKLDSLPFVPEITSAGKNFVLDRIKAPFLCAQLRLLDGQFKNHRKSTFLGLKQKLESLEKENSLHAPIHIFVMTDLPESNWTNSYLGELRKNSDTYKLHNLREGDNLVVQTAKKIAYARHGLQSEFLPMEFRTKKSSCPPGTLPDILLYIEETICSCASLGFVGTSGSTIAESIELLRKGTSCRITGQSYM
ncbi:hypothetical protein ACHQM5_014983 [Ranunculus cassubicifolius]